MNSAIVFITLVGTALTIIDTDCTLNGATYTSTAISCLNIQSDKFCDSVYAASLVKAGGTDERPATCYNGTTAVDPDIKAGAIATCPRTCGYCCKTTAYSCENARIPFQACDTIPPQMCLEPTWRALIEQDCPAACGFCNLGGCIDVAPYCTLSHCVTIGLETFVAENCRRTCDLCSTVTTTASSATTGTTAASGVTGSIGNCVDKTACASWVRKGFCTSTFYTAAAKRTNCPKACGLC